MTGETVAPSQALWDAVNAYASACGGDTGDATISGSRMDAVAAVGWAVERLVQERLEAAARVTLVDLGTLGRAEASATADGVCVCGQQADARAVAAVVRKLLAREAARLVPENMRAEVVSALRRGASALAEAGDSDLEVPDDSGCGLAECETCDQAPDPRQEWTRMAGDLDGLADHVERAPGAPVLVLEAVRLALAAAVFGPGAEERDVVDLVAAVVEEIGRLRLGMVGRVHPEAVVIVPTGPDGRVLMLRRPDASWTLPGGKLEPDESAASAAVRELAEEAGLVGVVDTQRPWHHVTIGRDGRVYSVHVVTMTVAVGDVRLSDEHVGARWADPAEVLLWPDVATDSTRQVLGWFLLRAQRDKACEDAARLRAEVAKLKRKED